MFKSFFESEKNFNIVLATAVLLILTVPVGIANVGLGYIIGESPCTGCWFERTGMMLIGVLGILMLRYGVKTKYLVCLALSAWWGLYMTLKHTGNVIGLDHGQGFGDSIMGAHTYSWGVFVYWVAVLGLAFLLMFIRKGNPIVQELNSDKLVIKPLSKYSTVIVALSLLVLLSNSFQAFLENGVPPFSGKRRPARFTLDISKASQDWTASVWTRVLKPWSLRGKENVEWPYVAGVQNEVSQPFSDDPSSGPLDLDGTSEVVASQQLPFEPIGFMGKGSVTGMSYNPQLQKYGFVTNNAGIYYTDPELSKVTDKAILDRPNGNDIRVSVDADFVGNKLIALSQNKTIWGNELKDPSKIDPWMQWRIFREATPKVAPVWGVDRPWLSTARARMNFVTTGTYDPTTNSLHLITVPNNKDKRTIVSSFDMNDRQVFQEKNLKASSKKSLKEGRKALDYYITASSFKDGKIYAISKNYKSLLVIDPQSVEIEKVYGLPKEVKDPASMTVVDGKIKILDFDGQKASVKTLEIKQ